MKRRDLINYGIFALAAVVVFLLPRFVSDFRAQQFAYVGIYFIALLGLNLLTGFTGQISLGHGAFMLIGGYTTAILMSNQEPAARVRRSRSSRTTCGTSGRSRSPGSSPAWSASSSASRPCG